MFTPKKINNAPLSVPSSPSIKMGCCAFRPTFRSQPRTPQEVYFESRGKCCKKLLKFNGYPNKVWLYPEEAWARSATSSYIMIKQCPWWKNLCIVEEIAGTRHKKSTYAKMISSSPGSLLIIGSFKKQTVDPDFKLHLTSNISIADYNMGYCLTGVLERGYKRTNKYQQTHFVVIRRRWPSLKDTKSS
ncbi:uncharacterized protein LOC116339402 [Contarinia nasturtii]|uniref:uncharacterized protein LOC116339402 n=1 Tax=Contarinia nasturtii TaxID=265458 RepID=UPI0012D3D23E|nr:uncharacterized protein LOC116339402 [Contarinia nasturtii]